MKCGNISPECIDIDYNIEDEPKRLDWEGASEYFSDHRV
jgi:hypothetical protein